MSACYETTYFVLKPHSSLGKQGFLILMLFISFISFGSGAFFAYLGAWPVLGFFGLEVLLIYGAFRLNYFAARRSEELEITAHSFKIIKTSPRGHVKQVTLNPYWMRLELKPSRHDPEVAGDLILRSHGRAYSIGEFLSPAERDGLFKALKQEIENLKLQQYSAMPV